MMRRIVWTAIVLVVLLAAGSILAASFTHWDDQIVGESRWIARDGSVRGYCMLKCVHAAGTVHGVLYRELDRVPGMTAGDSIVSVRTFIGRPQFPKPDLGLQKGTERPGHLHLGTR